MKLFGFSHTFTKLRNGGKGTILVCIYVELLRGLNRHEYI